jgi:hypothetical protein
MESCLDVGGIDCLLSVRRLDGITAVGCVEEPFVAANRLSNEGAPSPLPVLFLGFFADRGESWARLSRLFDAVLGPANIAFWAPRINISEADGMGLASVRSARGRVGAVDLWGGGASVVGRGGRECVRTSTCCLLADASLLLEPSIFVAGGFFAGLGGTSNCSNRKERVVGHR